MKALFIGLGSIGQRHLQNFIDLRPQYTPVLAYRTSKSNRVIKNGDVVPDKKLSKYYNLVEFFEINHALNENPNVAFICNPSSLHMETALRIAENNIHFFIEKPLAVSETGINDLENKINENKLVNMVGYQTRFNPIVIEANDVISSLKYGKIISAEFKWCTYLPDHHPYEDYRKGYAARKDLGGGVIFCLIHELDIIQWFFGCPISVYAVKGAQSKLEMDVEDDVSAILQFKYNASAFPLNLHLSFSQKVEERYFNVLMQDALLKVNLVTNKIEIIEHNKNFHYHNKYDNLDRNIFFKKELEEFIKAFENNEKTSIPVSEGKKSLMMALALNESIKNNKIITI